MRIPRLLAAAALLAACGDDPTVIVGELADGAEATHVWVLGEPERSPVSADSFRLEGVPGDLLDLRFAAEDEEVARMEIRGVAPGDRLRLRSVWFEDGVAYPSSVESGGEGVITVNGLRMAGAPVPREVDVAGIVLAVSRAGDALILRPADEAVPDLRVVVTPGTQQRTPDGDPASAEELEFGDSVRVVGQGESGYVIATELVLPRSRASGAAGPDPDEEARRRLAERADAIREGSGGEAARPAAAVREGERGRGRGRDDKPEREKRGRGKEKGKG